MEQLILLIRTIFGWLFKGGFGAISAAHAAKAGLTDRPRRNRRMDATALNDRRGSGMRCRGFLGAPAVQMLG